MDYGQSKRLLLKGARYIPLVLLIMIIEGTFRSISSWLILLYIVVRAGMAWRKLVVSGEWQKVKEMIQRK